MSSTAFTSLRVGPLTLPNRLALAPVKTALGGTDGLATRRHVAYYRRRAAGGAGLILVEPLFVDPKGREHPRQLGAHSDQVVPGLRKIVEAIHEQGALAFAHLNHAGRAANPKVIGGPPEAPSPVRCPSTGATPQALTISRIDELLGAYETAAERAREAGFDGVEVQLGLGYLPAQFISPTTNLRQDGYGFDGERRWRFVDEMIAVIRAAIGDGVAWTARLSADERCDGGLGVDDAIGIARRLEGMGAHGLHVVTGSACDSPPWYYQHMALHRGVNEALAARIRSEVSIPVFVAGRLGDPVRIREVLDQGLADVVALGRPLLADPDLPRKMREGREDEIIGCGACLQGCLARVKSGGPIGCIVNPEIGHEGEQNSRAPGGQERLVIVGGGPAGLQAALSGQRAGYDVTLFERDDELGGQFALAPLTPGKEEMERPFRSLVAAVERSGVEVRAGVEATVERIAELAPSWVVLATGSRPLVPSVRGLDEVLDAEQVLHGRAEVGRRVLVVGGGLVGVELAEHLARRGKEVVVVELLDEIARDMEAVTRKMTLRRLATLPVEVHTDTRLTRLVDGEAFAVTSGDERSLGRFDSVMAAVGHRAHDPLSSSLREAGIPAVVIGDAAQPGQVFDATQAGRQVLSAPSPARRVARIPKSAIHEMTRLSRQYDDVAFLSWAKPTVDTPEHIREAACAAIRDGLVGGYSETGGLPALREAIAHKLRRDNGVVARPDEVIVTVGAIEGLSATVMAVIDPGDEVILPTPTYSTHVRQVELASGRPVFVPLVEERGFAWDIEAVRRAVTPRTRAILFCTPSNPTGTAFSEGHLRQLAEIALEHDLVVITDEAYEYFTYDGQDHFSVASIPELRRHVVSCYTLTKTYAMTGWRIGYLHADSAMIAQIAKAHIPLAICAPVVSQYAALAALTGPQDCIAEYRDKYRATRDLMCARLDRLDAVFTYQKPNGAYLMFPRIQLQEGADSMGFCKQLLREARVSTTPGVAFGPTGQGHLRLSFCVPDEMVVQAFDRMEAYFS